MRRVCHCLLRHSRCQQGYPTLDGPTGFLSWSSFFAHTDKLFDRRFLLENIEWQVAQFGVEQLTVVKADDVARNVVHDLGMVGVILLPTAPSLSSERSAP